MLKKLYPLNLKTSAEIIYDKLIVNTSKRTILYSVDYAPRRSIDKGKINYFVNTHEQN